MAKVVYVDGANGDNGNTGLSHALAKRTILGARAATAAGDLVLIDPGVYVEGDVAAFSANDTDVFYMPNPDYPGEVIVDFENRAATNAAGGGGRLPHYWRIQTSMGFLGIRFRNPYPTHGFIGAFTGAAFINCVFHQRDGTANTGRAVEGWNSDWTFEVKNCTFHNMGTPVARMNGDKVRNNYFIDCTTPTSSMAGTPDYNAYSGNAETNGIDTDTNDPGVLDLSGEDFRLDPVSDSADFIVFMESGEDGGRIGSWGKNGVYYDADYDQFGFFTQDPSTGNPNVVWENEGPGGTNTYSDGTPGDIIEDGTTNELKIDLGAIPGATGGRVRSDVIDLGSGTTLLANAAFAAFEDGPGGALIDTETTLPQKFEYRTSATTFLKGAGSPSWVEMEQKDNLADTNRYIQFRVEFQTAHTNA